VKIKTSNLDRLFSQYIRTKANFTCKACKKNSGIMDCAHIVSRRSTATRWFKANAVCLCRACHMKFTADPFGWVEIVTDWMGEDKLQALRFLSHSGKPPKLLEKIAIGEALIEKIKELGEKPVCGLGKNLKKG